MQSPPSSYRSSTSTPLAVFSTFETSVTRIERTKWKINRPIPWKILDEEQAQNFIKTPLQRDKRKNMEKNRFRLLLVQYTDLGSQLYKQVSLLATAAEKGWIGERFKFFVKNNTGGSAALESGDRISFIAQTPTDAYPFFSFSLTDKYLEGRHRDADWVCLFFASAEFPLREVEDLLCRDTFPNDYATPLSPDFMFLPVAVLHWQVQQTSNELAKIKKEIIQQDEELVTKGSYNLEDIRTKLFQMRKRHVMLNRRWLFARELARNLAKCFERIEMRMSVEEPVTYSVTLKNDVLSQEANLGSLLHDLETTPMMIEAQQRMIDNQTNMMIAKNSEIVAHEARRDSAAMKTIAAVTLLFLPSTFIATIFSMSMFNWQPDEKKGERVVSTHIWLFVASALFLTLIVLAAWVMWYRWARKKYQMKWADIKSV